MNDNITERLRRSKSFIPPSNLHKLHCYLQGDAESYCLMASYGNYSSSRLQPSAPFLPETPCHDDLYSNFPAGSQVETPYGNDLYGNFPVGYNRPHRHSQVMPGVYSPGLYSFPVGTDPTVVRAFQMVDRDRSGFIDEKELQLALSSGYQRFNLRTIKLIMFLYRNPNDPARFGPKEFAALWSCLREWMAIFKRFDRDRSGKIDVYELRDALYSLGYALPPSVLQVLISRYDDGTGRRTELNFDSFVECGMIVKGLTEEFKEKDVRFSGSATISYDTFMSMVIPFLVSYN